MYDNGKDCRVKFIVCWHRINKTYITVYCVQLDPLADQHHVNKNYAIMYYMQLAGIMCTTTVCRKWGRKHPDFQYYVANTCILLIALEGRSRVVTAQILCLMNNHGHKCNDWRIKNKCNDLMIEKNIFGSDWDSSHTGIKIFFCCFNTIEI